MWARKIHALIIVRMVESVKWIHNNIQCAFAVANGREVNVKLHHLVKDHAVIASTAVQSMNACKYL